LKLHPELNRYWTQLCLDHPKLNDPARTPFKRLISTCKGGNFDTPELRLVKRHQQLTEWGTNKELGSWSTVLDKNGPVAYAALQAGTLPHVPRSLFPGGVLHRTWPDSHDFVVSRELWTKSWRKEIAFLTEADTSETNRQINEWFANNGETAIDSTTWDEMLADLRDGIPVGVTRRPPPVADTAVSGQEPAVCPDNGPANDELHAKATKHFQKLMNEWPRSKVKYQIALARSENLPRCGEVAAEITEKMAQIDIDLASITRTSNTIQAKGNGYYNDEDLMSCLAKCEGIALSNKSLVDMCKALTSLSQIK